MQPSAMTEFLHGVRLRMAHAAMAGDSDRQLLEKFCRQADDDAFAVLLQRYGPMVLGVCKRALGNEHEAEDAFQATFLVLVKKAAAIRKSESLASWLHGVAHRIAIKARGRSVRRRGVEERAAHQVEQPAMDTSTWNEVRQVLDDEIQRLPRKLRVPFLLCCLQDKTHAEAAAGLSCHRSTITARLAQASSLLCKRLTRRGVQVSPAILAGMLAEGTAKAALPAGLMVATARLATLWAAGETAAAGGISVGAIALAKETLKGMLAMKVKLVLLTMALGLMVGGVGVAEYPGFGSGVAKNRQAQRPPASATIAVEQPKPKLEQPRVLDQPRVDVDGNPLPEGALARLGSVAWLHDGNVTFAAFLPDGKSVITTSEDKTIRVWEFPSGKEIRRINLPINPSGVVLSKDGKTIATNNWEAEIRLHDITTGKELKTLKWEPGKELKMKGMGRLVGGMVFSPDGLHLAVQEFGGNVRIWDWANGKEVRNLPIDGPPFLAYTPDGKALATLASDRVKLRDPTTGAEMSSIGDNSNIGVINSAVFSPDGKTLAICSNQSAFLMEAATGKEIHKLPIKSPLTGPPMSMTAVFNKDGAKLYIFRPVMRDVGGGAGTTEVAVSQWNVATGELLREQAATPGMPPLMKSVVLSPDGNTLVVSGGSRRPTFLDLSGGKEIVVHKGTDAPRLSSLQFTPDGKSLLTSGFAAADKWDAATGKYLGKFDFPNSSPRGAISPDGKILAGLGMQGKDSGKVLIVDAASGKELGMLAAQEPISSDTSGGLRFSPDSKILAIWQGAKRRIELYEAATAKLLRTFDAVPGEPSREVPIATQVVVFSADGKALAHCETQPFAPKGGVTPMATVTLFDTASGKQTGVIQLPQSRPPGAGGTAAFSPDGRCLALDINEGTVALYELASARSRGSFGMKLPEQEAFPKPGGGKGGGQPDNRFSCFAFSVDGKSCAQAGGDGIVRVWDMLTGRELVAFKGHTGRVFSVAFAPDGNTLASLSGDGTGLIWDVSKVKRPPVAEASGSPLKPADLEKCWQTLVETDAAKAWAAMGDLLSAPKLTVPVIKDRLKPAAALDMKHVDALIRQLDNQQFKLREVAKSELLKLGEQIVPAIDKALTANPPLETKQRLEELRGKLTGMVLQGERLRAYRAIEVLELIGTPEARQVLRLLAEGAPGALVTKSAQAALKR